MEVIATIAALRARLSQEESVAFVPTMGNLHEGHLNLMRIARDYGHCVAASIFVNPLQFGANEDFSRYPRTLEQDCRLLEQCGVDVVLTPDERELYPVPQQVTVDPPLADDLCGAFRPGHFRGVATVVLKLLNIVQPRAAIFGKKDYQQLHVVRQLALQLNLPVEIVGGETVRAPDGLALSSRNQYLNANERTEAAYLYQTLLATGNALQGSNRDFAALEQQAVKALAARGWRVDYVAIRTQSGLGAPQPQERALVVLAAAWLGQTRLIDNIEVCV